MAQKKKNRKSDNGAGIELLDREKSKQRIKPPSKYQVVLHNDNYTPMEFVVALLVGVFHHSFESAWKITLDIHEKEKGIAGGPFSKEIATTKMMMCNKTAKQAGHPLKSTIEKVE